MTDRRPPLWLLPNLFSLDAPLVAVSWLWVFARTWRVDYLPTPAYLVLFLVVWSIYVFDRLFDAAMRTGSPELLEERHRFHLKHKRAFAIGGAIAMVVAIILTLIALPMKIFSYALFGGVLVLCFFALSIFSSPKEGEIPIAKNVVAGLSFAYGTAVAAHVQAGLGWFDVIREVLCFAVLCIVNITAVDLWARVKNPDREARADTDLAITLPLAVLACAAVIFAVQDHDTTTRPFYYAILTASALLYILNRMRWKFSPTAQRVLVDLAVLAPVLIVVVSR